MEKQCLIKQPAGLGDIFFCQKIAKQIIDKLNFIVYWPITSKYLYLNEYIKYKNLRFINVENLQTDFNSIYYSNTPIKTDNFIFLPLQNASTYLNLNSDEIMSSKYKLLNLEWNDWSDYFEFNRNFKRENELYDYLNPKNLPFILINNKFATPPNIEEIPINIKSDKKIIYMDSTGFDNVFDWCKLLEKADEIHTVNTSFCYIIEKLNVCDKLYMYQRGNYFKDFNYVKDIYKKPWTYKS